MLMSRFASLFAAQRVAENPVPYSATDNDLESLLLTLCKEMTPESKSC
jgi:hypothetical protein